MHTSSRKPGYRDLLKVSMVLAGALFAALSHVVAADTLESNTIYVNTSTHLYQIDEVAGTATMVGEANPSFSQIEDIAFDNQNLYGLTYLMQVYKYDPAASMMNPVNDLTSYALHHRGLEARNGIFYAAETYSLDTMNIQTGTFSVVGYYGLGAGENVTDLAFDENGTLYASISFGLTYDYLGTIDVTSGSMNIIGNTFVSGLRAITVKNGVIYGMNSVGDLVTINKTSGMATLLKAGLVPGAYGMDTSPAAINSGSVGSSGDSSAAGTLSLPLLLLIPGIAVLRKKMVKIAA